MRILSMEQLVPSNPMFDTGKLACFTSTRVCTLPIDVIARFCCTFWSPALQTLYFLLALVSTLRLFVDDSRRVRRRSGSHDGVRGGWRVTHKARQGTSMAQSSAVEDGFAASSGQAGTNNGNVSMKRCPVVGKASKQMSSYCMSCPSSVRRTKSVGDQGGRWIMDVPSSCDCRTKHTARRCDLAPRSDVVH